MGSRNMVPTVSSMSGSPTFDTEKKTRKIERGEFITPPRPTRRRSKKYDFHISQLIGNLLSGIAEGENDFRNTKDFIHR